MSKKDLDTCPSPSGGHGAGIQAKKMRYTFSKETVAEFYGRKFYSITNTEGELCAYSERVFEIPKEVTLHPGGKTIIFEKAVLHGGEMHGGEMWGGEMWGGVMRGGVMWGGEMWGGVMRGGVMRGGVMRGGEMHGGVMRGGVIKVSMLQIQGTRHFCYASFTEDEKEIWLGVGCHFKPISEWIETYKRIGVSEGYTADEIEEYSGYIEVFAKRYAPELLKNHAKKVSKK